MSGSVRSSVWDPSLIISQMLCVQASYCITLGAWIVILDLMIGPDLSLGQMYDFEVSSGLF